MVNKITGKDIKLISIDLIDPHPDNPNKQSEFEFDQLLREIEDDGFDEAILVINHPDKEGRYMIVAGEHRHAAMRALGEEDIPVIVKDWTLRESRLKTVRRNVIHGSLNRTAFGELIKKLNEEDEISMLDLPDELALTEKEFNKLTAELNQQEEQEISDGTAAVNSEEHIVDNMGYVLNEILSEYGGTIPDGYIFFFYGNKFHLMVIENKALEMVVEKMVNYTKATHSSITDFLESAINRELDRLKQENPEVFEVKNEDMTVADIFEE